MSIKRERVVITVKEFRPVIHDNGCISQELVDWYSYASESVVSAYGFPADPDKEIEQEL